MPLPDPGTAWPPTQYCDVFKDIEECADWWEGDADKLAQRYSRGTSTQTLGLRGWFHSLWWGKQLDDTSDRLHMPVAADLAQTSATLLFAEPPTFNVPQPDLGDDKDGKPVISDGWQKAQDRLDLIANAAPMRATLLEAAEKCAALGGVYLRVVFDKEAGIDHAFLDVMDADLAIPEWRWGRLVAVTFWSELPSSDKVVWRHLERHSMGRIEHALYMGTRESIGNPVELTAHPHTAKYAAMLTDEFGYATGVEDGLTVAYVPNLRPNPKWRKNPQLKNLGRSDISPDLIPLFDKVDELWSSLAREFDIGKGRLFIPEELLDTRGPGKGSMFDTDKKAFTLTAGAGNDEQTIHAEQFNIRVQEHLAAIDALIREILRRVGYSPGTFGLVDDGGAMTATEVASKRAASIATKTAKGRLWQAALAPLLRTLLAVDAIQFGTGAEVLEDIDVEWPAAYKESDLVRAQTVQAMDAARAISTYEKVAYLHPDWDAADIQAEADLILDENTVADPFAMAPDAPVDPVPVDEPVGEDPQPNPFDNAA